MIYYSENAQLYLVAFNIISALGWGYILILSLFHLPNTASLSTLFYCVRLQVVLVQMFAVLEVFHVLLGWVRSPIQITVMQVLGRLFLVWGITEQFSAVRNSQFVIFPKLTFQT